MAMTDMRMSTEEAQEQAMCSPDGANPPMYPYGLQLDFNDETLAKLGLTQMPEVGSVIQISAMCEVRRTTTSAEDGAEAESSVSLQITAMELGESQTQETMASKLYANKAYKAMGPLMVGTKMVS